MNIMKPNTFICFIGIDGSGKSTLAKALLLKMKREGVDVIYVWAKFESLLLKFIISLKNHVLIREKNISKNYEQSSKIKHQLFTDKIISRCYELFVLISYSMQIFHKIFLPLKRGKTIICDRYVYDTIVDLSIDLKYSTNKTIHKMSFFNSLYPSPDLIFLVDVPEDVSLKRKFDIPSREFLRCKRRCYKHIGALANIRKIILLDGTKSLTELNNEIITTIINYL